MGLKDKLKENIIVLDGAMGTMVQSKGLKLGELPEILNIESPDIIIDIHKKYVEAGADIITTNTFGANELKLTDQSYSVEDIINHSVLNAKKAIDNRDVYIGLDIGPIGELLEPMGTLEFGEAYNIFKRQIIQGVKSGVDLFIIETMTDLYEMKAAILAAKENSNLPIFATMSFEENMRTFTGCTPLSMVMTLEGLGVDVLGINCSLGPKEIELILDEVLKYASIPVMIQSNAGLPTVIEGETVYNVSPEEYSEYGKKFVEKGVRVIGGCCGTTDKYIKDIVDKLEGIEPVALNKKNYSGVCTATKAIMIDNVKVIGERINPTGKKLFQEALREGNLDYILKEAIAQVEAGADVLDINVGLPEIDEAKIMVNVIKEIQSIVDIPLQIDSSNPKAIEEGLRIYNGKAIVNSVNGEDKVLDTILPIVKKYGASVIGLTLDEEGIPMTGIERFKVAEKIVKRAEEYGISRENVFIDCLTLTAAAQQKEVKETLEAIRLVKDKLGVKTALGVSNVSFGLPNRELINKVFFGAALYEGLDLPIIDPLDKAMMDTIFASNVLWNKDIGGRKYLESYKKEEPKKEGSKRENKTIENKLDLIEIITKGIKEDARNVTNELLKDIEPLDIVNKYLIPGLDIVGERYEKGIIFLPHKDYSEMIDADFYGNDAKMAVEIAQEILG